MSAPLAPVAVVARAAADPGATVYSGATGAAAGAGAAAAGAGAAAAVAEEETPAVGTGAGVVAIGVTTGAAEAEATGAGAEGAGGACRASWVLLREVGGLREVRAPRLAVPARAGTSDRSSLRLLLRPRAAEAAEVVATRVTSLSLVTGGTLAFPLATAWAAMEAREWGARVRRRAKSSTNAFRDSVVMGAVLAGPERDTGAATEAEAEAATEAGAGAEARLAETATVRAEISGAGSTGRAREELTTDREARATRVGG